MSATTEYTVQLSQEACEALKREAWGQIENDANEYTQSLRDPRCAGSIEESRNRILGAAEVLGELGWGRAWWGRGEIQGRKYKASTHPFAFSAAAMDWLTWRRAELAEHMHEIDLSGETPVDVADEAYRLHVLNRIVDRDARPATDDLALADPAEPWTWTVAEADEAVAA